MQGCRSPAPGGGWPVEADGSPSAKHREIYQGLQQITEYGVGKSRNFKSMERIRKFSFQIYNVSHKKMELHWDKVEVELQRQKVERFLTRYLSKGSSSSSII